MSCRFPDRESRVNDSQDIFIGKIEEIISFEEIDNDDPWGASHEIIANLRVLEVIRGDIRKFQNVRFSKKVSAGEYHIIFDNSAYSSWCTNSLSAKIEDAGWYLDILNFESSIYNKLVLTSVSAPTE